MDFVFEDRTITINIANMAALLDEVRRRFRAGTGFALATINLDHLAKMAKSPDFVRAYCAQDLVVADGNPIVALSRLAHKPVGLVPGADMILPLCQLAGEERVKLALVGSTNIALQDAATALRALVANLDIALCIAPSGQFDPDGDEAAAILTQLDKADIQLCFLALGAPKQELLAVRGRKLSPKTGFASIGAGLDFLGGHQHRAPMWMRKLAIEWLWRALSSPRRLIPRYARCFAILPRQTLAALRQR
ncbi:MAG: N-acetylglucosaminyldiphosphoundecaprenol N-acetyl-beta-D-mannosaminyltransferase [Paracoccaceae bacterium]